MSNEKLQELLGNNYIPERLETVPIDAVIAELADQLLMRTKNFANIPFTSVADWLAYSTENTKKLREILQPLTTEVDPVLKAEFLHYATSNGIKHTPSDIVFIHKYLTPQRELCYVWLEIGNRTAGLIHMITQRKTNPGLVDGHITQYQNNLPGINSFQDLFTVLHFLLECAGEWTVNTDGPAFVVSIESSVTLADNNIAG